MADRRLLFCLFVLVALALLSVGALAQTAPERPKPHVDVQAIFDRAKPLEKEFKWDEVLKVYNEGLTKAKELGDVFGQGRAWQLIGNTYYAQGNLLKAQESFQHAKGFFAQAKAEDDEMGMLGNLAIVKDNMGYPMEAKPIYLQLLAYYRGKDNKRNVSNMLLNLAILSNGIDEPREVLKYAVEARAIKRELGDKRWEASALGLIADAQHSLGMRSESRKSHEEALRIAREGGFKSEEASELSDLGSLKREEGDLLGALNLFEQSLKIRRETNSIRFQGTTLINLGIVYDLLGQSDLAVSSLTEAIDIFKKIGSRPDLATALNNLGVVHNQAKRQELARPALEEALALYRQIGDKSGQASCLSTLGSILREAKQYEAAIKLHREALALYQTLGRTEEVATVNDGIANALIDQGKYKEAEPYHRRAVETYNLIGNKRFAASTLANVARSLVKQKRLKEADATYKHSIELIEEVRSGLGASSEGKSEFVGRRLDIYRSYIDLLVQRGKPEEAYAVVQRTKSRSLLDILGSGNAAIESEMTPSERARERELRERADRINAQMVREGAQNEVGAKKRFAALKTELLKCENEIAAFTANLYSKHPLLARKRSVGIASLNEIASKLPQGTTLVEYVLTDVPRAFLISRVGGKPRVAVVGLPIGRNQLESLSLELAKSLANPALPYQATSKKLHAALIAPLSKNLRNSRRLVICPDGALWDVPFAALFDGRFLIERYEIAYAFSGTAMDGILDVRPRQNKENSLLIVANPNFGGADRFGDNPLVPGQRPIEPPSRPIEPPSRPIEPPSRPIEPPSRDLTKGLSVGIVDLPGTQQEADAIAQLFPGANVLNRKKAQESAFMREAGKYRWLHIASHAFINDASPMLSSIVLAVPDGNATDGYLTARELLGMKLKADLVVLSACNTARGAKKSGEGIVGLSWALFAAGAPSQVVSQWSVDDRATAVLMKRFYANLKAGDDKGEALRKAARSLMNVKAAGNNPRWSHPYYWAPFILVGDWR